MAAQEDSKISKLLKYKGLSNIKENKINNKIISTVLGYESDLTPGISIKFLEYKKQETETGEWNEYNILIRAIRYKDTPEYLEHVFKSIAKIIQNIGTCVNTEINSIGIQEVKLDDPDAYYILIYILDDGKIKTIDKENYY